MEDLAPYCPDSIRQFSQPVKAVLREHGFASTELFAPDGSVGVQGAWINPGKQVFLAIYQHQTRTGRKTLELRAQQGAYAAGTGRLLVRDTQDVAYLLSSWEPLAEARAAPAGG